MSFSLPRKRTILAWHRWMGVAAAFFLLVVSVTGLVLNHTTTLKLDQVEIRNPFILARYGMTGADAIQAYRIHETDTLAHLDGQLFYNGQRLASAGKPVGIIESSPMSVVATPGHLVYLAPDGLLIEQIGTARLPFSEIQALGLTSEEQPIVVTPEGTFTPDADWLQFTSIEASYRVNPLPQIDLTPSEADAVLEAFQGGGISLYRVLLDLHSGRLFGWGGRTLMDLTALAVVLLVSSGLAGWLRKSRRTPQKGGA